MEEKIIINRIKKLCKERNDRELKLDFFYNDKIFHSKYVFLANHLYITDTLETIELKDLDKEILEEISTILNIYDN